MCDMIYSWTSSPTWNLQVSDSQNVLSVPTKCGNQQDNMKVFPMGLYFVYMSLPPFDDFAACIKKEI